MPVWFEHYNTTRFTRIELSVIGSPRELIASQSDRAKAETAK